MKYQKIFEALDSIRSFLLYEQIRSTLQEDFFYMSQTSQNEFIGFVTKYTIQKCLSIFAD